MALIAALLLTILLSAAVGGLTMIAGIERQTSSSHALGLELRLAAAGAGALVAAELAVRDWGESFAGGGSASWRRPVSPSIDIAALTAGVQQETMAQSAHGADTPVWRVFAHMPWADVAGHQARAQVIAWVADDWAEADGDASRDGNGRLLVRAVALAGAAASWTETLCARGAGGRIEARHLRSW